jgi:hypothetical protein
MAKLVEVALSYIYSGSLPERLFWIFDSTHTEKPHSKKVAGLKWFHRTKKVDGRAKNLKRARSGTLSGAQRTGRSPLAAVPKFGANPLEADCHGSIAGRDATPELVLVQTRRYPRTGTSAFDRPLPSSTFSHEGDKCYLEVSKTVCYFKELTWLKSRELQVPKRSGVYGIYLN